MGSDFYSLTPAEQGERLTALARAALPHWNLEGAALEIIKMRENAVFCATMPDGARYALRIHRHAYHTDTELHSELLWMRALDASGVNVPTLIPSITGDLLIKAGHAGVPEVRQVDLFAWVDGRQLGSAESGAAGDNAEIERTFHTLGELTGRIHNQASAWRVPPGFQRHAWDTDGLVGENPFWGRFWELAALTPDQRELIQRGREQVGRDLDAFGRRPETYSLIHADFTPENLLVDGEFVRPIDFDDAGFGWHLFDLATSLFFHFDAKYFPAARNALVQGYREVRPLPDRDLDRLPLFFVARGFTYLGWVHTRHETQTAQELTPMLVDLSCRLTEKYLSRTG
jgi:Ser/Thr protein kinase RdoA (MazF antagonist)